MRNVKLGVFHGMFCAGRDRARARAALRAGGHVGCGLQWVKMDFSSRVCIKAALVVVCHLRASHPCAFLSVLLQK